jgi:hypothetical protein
LKRLARARLEDWEVEQFRCALEIDMFPAECLECFKAGIRFCRYWGRGFVCDHEETMKNMFVPKKPDNIGGSGVKIVNLGLLV